MAKFRKRPVVIEAMQFTKDTQKQVLEWTGAFLALPALDANGDVALSIHTLEGDMLAREGDYIIKGVKGEFYPCKPDIFAATYEPVEG